MESAPAMSGAITMGTSRRIYASTNFRSIENARKKDKSKEYELYEGRVYVRQFSVRMAGRVKDFVLDRMIGDDVVHDDFNGYGYQR